MTEADFGDGCWMLDVGDGSNVETFQCDIINIHTLKRLFVWKRMTDFGGGFWRRMLYQRCQAPKVVSQSHTHNKKSSKALAQNH